MLARFHREKKRPAYWIEWFGALAFALILAVFWILVPGLWVDGHPLTSQKCEEGGR